MGMTDRAYIASRTLGHKIKMEEKKPFFSVITPQHNSAAFMRKGLDSIKKQDFTDYELIIVCDRCSDNTVQIAEEYSDIVLEVDFGMASLSRNAGLDIATGEWVLFLDDDDWYKDGAFQRIAEEIKRQPDIDILAYGFEWKGRGTALQSSRRVFPAIWNKAWRRDFIGEERFPPWIHTDDLGFARKMHKRARFGFLAAELYFYNFMRPGSVSDRIKNGEYDNSQLPEEIRGDADRYEIWLKRNC